MTHFLPTLMGTRSYQSEAMKKGLASEPEAVRQYALVNNNQINIYPCGIIISPFQPHLAASPDRRVYDPDRAPHCYGLLEIKWSECPVSDVKYLSTDATGARWVFLIIVISCIYTINVIIALILIVHFSVTIIRGNHHKKEITLTSSVSSPSSRKVILLVILSYM